MIDSAFSDAEVRRRAVTTFDREVVVTAGAGTGKTTLLVERLLHLLLRGKDPLKVTEWVALTYTNRAAGQMRVRVREVLRSFLDRATGGKASLEEPWNRAYDLLVGAAPAAAAAAGRLRQALEDLERAQISTIHSFAAHLLRGHPLEAGIDPGFTEDDGTMFEMLFGESWREWLRERLEGKGPERPSWEKLLRSVERLETLEETARVLCGEVLSIGDLEAALQSGRLAEWPPGWVGSLAEEAGRLSTRYPGAPKVRKIEEAIRDAAEFFRLAGLGDPESRLRRELLARGLPEAKGKPVKGWSQQDHEEACRLVSIARDLGKADPERLRLVLEPLLPFARAFRERFARAGYLSFDALLVRARDLLRDFPLVRRELKERYQAVLVDEFQDTDPLQYEIVFYLAERADRHAEDWRKAVLEPGKLFIVGDPKQSIYAFRRADIAVYHEVVEERLSCESLDLKVNFRSVPPVIVVVNGVFQRLITRQEKIQPSYVPLLPWRAAASGGKGASVRLRLVIPSGKKWNAEEATRADADELAWWMRTELLGRGEASPGDVGMLFRTMSRADVYVEALRRQGIPYLVEGEKTFYRTQEVTDGINLLRVLAHPHDRLALVGVLRSPVGGLADRRIAELARDGKLDLACRGPGVPEVYGRLVRLSEEMRGLPLGGAVDRLLEELPLLEWAAASAGGEQATANLLKIARMAREQGARAGMDLAGFVRFLNEQVTRLQAEGEHPLAEEEVDAVKVMTVHKAKGLEFPVVVLPGLHLGTSNREEPLSVRRDGATGLWKVSIEGVRSPASVYLKEFERRREEAEERRVFYVAMTRARDRLILTAGKADRQRGGFLGLLEEAVPLRWDEPGPVEVVCGEGRWEKVVVPWEGKIRGAGSAAQKRAEGLPDLRELEKRWADRRERAEDFRKRTVEIRPSRKRDEDGYFPAWEGGEEERGLSDAARLTGIAAHRVLQQIDFSRPAKPLVAAIGPVLDRVVPSFMAGSRDAIRDDLRRMFDRFFESEIFHELSQARILGREVPCLLSWKEPGGDLSAAVEGCIDLIYEKDGRIGIVDYKTDRVGSAQVGGRAERYRSQGRIYLEAARRAWGDRVACFDLVFLRVPVRVRWSAEELEQRGLASGG
jgi:ATP-dependent helicase/nuclease subunit A